MSDPIELLGNVVNPTSTSLPDNSTNPIAQGRQTDLLTSEIHGKYYAANYRGRLFWANVTAQTIPVIAATLASVFSLYNPVGSGVNLEVVDMDISQVLATTKADTFGLYYSSQALTSKGTFGTLGTASNTGSGIIGTPVGGQGQFYSSYTHSGTPVRCANIGGFGATTNVSLALMHYEFDGRVIIPPGVVVSLALATAVSVASSIDVSMRWCEWPV